MRERVQPLTVDKDTGGHMEKRVSDREKAHSVDIARSSPHTRVPRRVYFCVTGCVVDVFTVHFVFLFLGFLLEPLGQVTLVI